MSFDKIQKITQSLVKSFDDNEKLATPILSAKLDGYVKAYPSDKTIGAIARVIEKLADNKTSFIRRADLKSLYNKMYNVNTKFAEFFQEELGQPLVETNIKLATSYSGERADSKSSLVCKTVDTVFSNALASAIDKTIPLKTYSNVNANKAYRMVMSILDSWSLKPSHANIDIGNEKFLVIKADYETPKGISSFYIPLETVNNKIVEPTIFIGNTGIHDLNNNNIKTYLINHAGQKLKINSQNILDTLVKSASSQKPISQAELALIKLHESRKTASKIDFNYDTALLFNKKDSNYVVGQKVAQVSISGVQVPKLDDFASFEKTFSNPQGVANFNFGKDNVKLATEVIAREIIGFGYKNPQIKVSEARENAIIYSVSLDGGRVAFSIPVKIREGKINKPNVLLCNGKIASFTKESINKLYINNETDYKVASIASPLHELKDSELIETIKQAAKSGNMMIAEDALNVLRMGDNKQSYAMGLSVYLTNMNKIDDSSKISTASKENKCNFIINSNKKSVSQHEICGHTGLPLHKTFIDKQGNCRPLYRKNMDETYEGAMFMNAKIFG